MSIILTPASQKKPSGCGRHTAYGLVRACAGGGGRSTTGDGGGGGGGGWGMHGLACLPACLLATFSRECPE